MNRNFNLDQERKALKFNDQRLKCTSDVKESETDSSNFKEEEPEELYAIFDLPRLASIL